MPTRKVIAVAVLISFVPQFALADQVVLGNGEALEGTVANRENLAQKPLEQKAVAILVETDGGGSDLLRFPVGDIEYVVLEDNGSERVIDFAGLETDPMGKPPLAGGDALPSYYDGHYGEQNTGNWLIVLGAAAAILGVAVKFGDEKLTVTSSEVDYDEKSYNGLNYALMVGGGALFVIGIVAVSKGKSGSTRDASLSWNPTGTTYVGIGFRF